MASSYGLARRDPEKLYKDPSWQMIEQVRQKASFLEQLRLSIRTKLVIRVQASYSLKNHLLLLLLESSRNI